MSNSREKYWSNVEQFSSIEGISGDLYLYNGAHTGGASLISTEIVDQKRAMPFRALPSGTPNWCHVAFIFEKQRARTERTDWGFVAPVWIAIGLFCTLVQIVAFQTILSVFG